MLIHSLRPVSHLALAEPLLSFHCLAPVCCLSRSVALPAEHRVWHLGGVQKESEGERGRPTDVEKKAFGLIFFFFPFSSSLCVSLAIVGQLSALSVFCFFFSFSSSIRVDNLSSNSCDTSSEAGAEYPL